ncbi:hypothetical protein [Chitinophaga sp. S165]|uniref:hypothetical protein n=1 Tax=Chitinophaga sp. S165 TaxID=2135462 RepID=UPI000D71C002|nr:hypothetical protein [Chitinophaga sp. S165]PWV56442.1 hypothetical protein C7475_101958 [Chitinophaga sp. S165]
MRNRSYLIYLLFAACVCSASKLSAQSSISDQPSLTKITPPAPNAAALGKFGDVPVSLATGIPQINVPLYSFHNIDNSLNLDVTLDYHAGGVRVDEMASDVGIGWALNAGGAVTRTCRGIQDEASMYGFMNAPSTLNEELGNDCYKGYYPNFFGRVASSEYDGQNDIFTFNFGNKTGKFVYGKNGDFLMLTSNKVKVQHVISADEITKFTITDEKGARYIFDAIERSDDGTSGNFHIHASAWYLTKIIAPFSTDSITFEYENEFSSYTSGKFVTDVYALGGALPPSKSAPETSYSSVITNGKRLKKINFPNQVTISFIYDTALRTDQTSPSALYRLKQISISDGAFTRGYNLYHDYSVNRLTLKRVVPYSASGEAAGYELSYTGSLPAYLSNEQDHWGFYNTNPSGDMIPEYFDKTRNVTLPGGKRSTDPNRVKSASLTRMKYPTGGYTDFEMEANTSEDPRLSDSVYIITKEKSFSQGLYVSTSNPGTLPFSFNGDAGSTTTFNIRMFQLGTCLGGNPCYLIVELRNSSNQVIKTVPIQSNGSAQYEDYPFDMYNMQPGNYSFYAYLQNMDYSDYLTLSWIEKHNNNPDTTKIYKKDLYIGGLRIKSIKDYDGIRFSPASTRTYEYVKKGSTMSSGALGVLPVYEYPVFYEFYESIGITGGESLPVNNNYNGYGLTNYIARASSPTQSLATINGSPVTYSRVVENYMNDSLSNGKKECYFTSYTTGGLAGYNGFPFTPPKYFDWSFGQLEKEVIYNKDNDSVKVTVNQYQTTLDNYYNNSSRLINFSSIALTPVKYAFRAIQGRAGITEWSQVDKPIYFASRVFTPGAGRKDLAKTIVTEYANGIGMSTETSYTYDTAFNTKTVVSFNSRGEKIETVKYYPYEYSTSTANAMKVANMYEPEISVETWKTIGSNKYLVNGYVNQYASVASGIRKTGIAAFTKVSPVLSSSLGAFNANNFNRDASVFKDLLSFSQYTAKGFVNEQSKMNDSKSTYIYGYNGSNVIAEVANASANEVAFTSFEEDGKGNWTYGGTPSINTTAMSGGKVYVLSGGAISKSGLTTGKAYKISYWSKSGAATVNGTSLTQGPVRNGWTYFEHLLPAGNSSVSVSGSVTIDDLRLYPVDATMSSFTYQPLYGITSICDGKNSFSYFTYDGFGRLIIVKDQDGKILKQYSYEYQAAITK